MTNDDPLGVFRPVWYPDSETTSNAHLRLLHLNDLDWVAMERIFKVVKAGGWEASADRLLTNPNWRGHLVAAAAVCLGGPGNGALPSVWAAFDRGSWVAPQLASVACLVDPEFDGNALRRLAAGCPVNPPAGLSPLEEHTAMGPSGPTLRSAKNVAALYALLGARESAAPQFDELSKDHLLEELLEADVDNSGAIALRWMARCIEAQTQLGVGQ